MSIKGCAHDVVKAFSEFLVAICEMCDEGITVRQVMNGDSHDHADSREDNSIWRRAALKARPRGSECRLVYMTVNPIAVFKIVAYESVYCFECWEDL
jgi:hypothetical protein